MSSKIKHLGSPIKWAGGKRWLVPILRPLWDVYLAALKDMGCEDQARLVEPFCGGAAVAFGFRPRRAMLNDVNVHLINFFRWLQRGINWDGFEFKADPECYYRHRQRFNYVIQNGGTWEEEAARLFFYLNRLGYNGLCRFNRRGEFNVPFGRYRRVSFGPERLAPYPAVIREWGFTPFDFSVLHIAPMDFVYVDPPYFGAFDAFNPDGFGWNDHVRLAEWISRQECVVVVSNALAPEIETLYQDVGLDIIYVEGPRSISCVAEGRKPVKEILGLKLPDWLRRYIPEGESLWPGLPAGKRSSGIGSSG